MSYNIAAGSGNLDRTTEAIRAAAADLVALQEVDVHWSARSGFADQAAALGERLGMQARFARIYQLPGDGASARLREYGVALLSRYPVVTWTNHTITRLSTQIEGTPPAPMPGFLEATVDVRGTRIRVFNTHLDYRPDATVRRRQVTETLAIIGDPSAPTLLFGDLNAPPTAPELQPLLARLRDSWTVPADPGLTYPATVPVKRIDYVLTSRHFRVRSARVPDTQASDHRPVVVDLVVDRVRD
jgi:endonuclease/exonuclease/phosphatase family metal-dependent hydrolase